jgi:cold shock CspA family protein
MDSSNRKAAGRMCLCTFLEKAGLSTLNEGQQVEFEIVSNRGKSSAENLKVK